MAPILTVVFQNKVLQLEQQINYNTTVSAIMTLRTSHTHHDCQPKQWHRVNLVQCAITA